MRFRKIRWGSWWWLGELYEVPRCYFEGDWGFIVLGTVFLVFCIFFNKCLYFSYYMAGYFLDSPLYIYVHIHIHIFRGREEEWEWGREPKKETDTRGIGWHQGNPSPLLDKQTKLNAQAKWSFYTSASTCYLLNPRMNEGSGHLKKETVASIWFSLLGTQLNEVIPAHTSGMKGTPVPTAASVEPLWEGGRLTKDSHLWVRILLFWNSPAEFFCLPTEQSVEPQRQLMKPCSISFRTWFNVIHSEWPCSRLSVCPYAHACACVCICVRISKV